MRIGLAASTFPLLDVKLSEQSNYSENIRLFFLYDMPQYCYWQKKRAHTEQLDATVHEIRIGS